MLLPDTVDDLNKVYPQYSFTREGGGIYCFDDEHIIHRVAECGYSDYFAFTGMTNKISPAHFKSIYTATQQIISAYLFFCNPFFEKHRIKLSLYAAQSPYFNRNVMGQQVVVNYVTKCQDGIIYWSPEVQMGNSKFYLHLTNYNNVDEINLLLTKPSGQLVDISVTIDTVQNNHKVVVDFFFEHMFKPYLGIEANDFTREHLKVLDMLLI